MQRLPVDVEPVARKILRSLVTSERTKDLLSLEQIVKRAGLDGKQVEQAIHDLIHSQRLLREVDGDPIRFEFSHESLVDSVAEWLEATDLRIREVQEMLEQEVSNARKLAGFQFPLDKWRLIDEHKEHLTFDLEALYVISKAFLDREQLPEFWIFKQVEVNHRKLLQISNNPPKCQEEMMNILEDYKISFINSLGNWQFPFSIIQIILTINFREHKEIVERTVEFCLLDNSGKALAAILNNFEANYITLNYNICNYLSPTSWLEMLIRALKENWLPSNKNFRQLIKDKQINLFSQVSTKILTDIVLFGNNQLTKIGIEIALHETSAQALFEIFRNLETSSKERTQLIIKKFLVARILQNNQDKITAQEVFKILIRLLKKGWLTQANTIIELIHEFHIDSLPKYYADILTQIIICESIKLARGAVEIALQEQSGQVIFLVTYQFHKLHKKRVQFITDKVSPKVSSYKVFNAYIGRTISPEMLINLLESGMIFDLVDFSIFLDNVLIYPSSLNSQEIASKKILFLDKKFVEFGILLALKEQSLTILFDIFCQIDKVSSEQTKLILNSWINHGKSSALSLLSMFKKNKTIVGSTVAKELFLIIETQINLDINIKNTIFILLHNGFINWIQENPNIIDLAIEIASKLNKKDAKKIERILLNCMPETKAKLKSSLIHRSKRIRKFAKSVLNKYKDINLTNNLEET